MSDRTKSKSQSVQLVLAALFGPLGLFYSSVPAAILLTLATALLVKDTGGEGAPLAWPVAIAAGFITVRHWNRRAERARAIGPNTQPGDQPCTQPET